MSELVWTALQVWLIWTAMVRPILQSKTPYDILGFTEETRAERNARYRWLQDAEQREWEARRDAGFDHRTLKGTGLS